MTSETHNFPILSVTQLTNAIKHCLESTFPSIWLQGEISNCKFHSSGHLYFSLKDSHAQIAAIMFRTDALSLKNVPKDGMQVVVRGEINLYSQGGKYQILVREMKPVGIGELLLKLEELKVKLQQRGWFRAEHKKPLPHFPKKIGVITSPTGAAIQDILNILNRRFSGFHLILNPVRVQGEGAAQEIAKAINQFNSLNLVDVIIVGRGGGSIEDLWAFNEEIVAEAIFNSQIPIISAVGHETDHSIADYVADVRAPTPSAAAEIVIAEKVHYLKHLAQLRQRMQQTLFQLISKDRHRLKGLLRQPSFRSPYGILSDWTQRLDDLKENLINTLKQKLERHKLLLDSRSKQLHSLKPTVQLTNFKNKLAYWDKGFKTAFYSKLENFRKLLKNNDQKLFYIWNSKHHKLKYQFDLEVKQKQLYHLWQKDLNLRKERLNYLINGLKTIDPKNLLTKGYCILFSENDHSAITSVRAVQKNQEIRVMLADGELTSTVNHIFPSD